MARPRGQCCPGTTSAGMDMDNMLRHNVGKCSEHVPIIRDRTEARSGSGAPQGAVLHPLPLPTVGIAEAGSNTYISNFEKKVGMSL